MFHSTRRAMALWLVLPVQVLAQAPTPRPARPPLADREAVPGRLRVRVFALDVPGASGPTACWLYTTDGFRRDGQHELALAVRRRPSEAPEAFPDDPISFFATLLRRAAKGEAASEETLTRFQEDGFVVSLTTPSWQAVKEALAQGRDLQLLGAPESMVIRIRWRD